MKNTSLLILCIIFNTTFLWSQGDHTFKSKFTVEQLTKAPAMLIPFPQQITWDNEFLDLKELYVEQAEPLSISISKVLKEVADFYKIRLSEENGYPVNFKNNKNLGKEAYHLMVSKNGIEIEAAAEAGYFYALQTLRQLIQTKQGKQVIPICKIKDAPAFPVRGYMIDVGRNFQSMASLKKQLDIMAMYKLNVFHWHLTDRPAWRIESKKYPELTAAKNHRPTRDPGKYYSYDDIRALIQYAKERHISIIPEIDMPGHSDSFVKSMGVKMESEKGMEILENVLNEFFQEISVSDCPVIHIGSDEVRIKNPDEFISNMVNICEKNGRKVVVWNPGLKANNKVIRQTWQTKHVEKAAFQEIDSWNNYVNNGEPMTQIQRLFFKPIGYPSDNEVIGGILGFWPDVNIKNEIDAFFQNPVFPSMLTYAWKTWTADITQAPTEYYMTLPPKGSVALNYFASFENILMHHKNIFFKNEPFQYYSQNDKVWKVIGTFKGDDGDNLLKNIKNTYSYQGKKLNWKNAVGNTLVIKDRFKLGGYFPDAKKGQTAYALTYIHSDKNQTVDTWIGYETPMRPNRTYTGIPEKGKWDASGGNIWINDKPLSSPKWKNPGWKPSKSEGWGSPQDQEIPWGEEELYWTRTPSKVVLKKGWNKVFVKIPCSSDYQNWMFTFIPLNMEGLSFSINPTDHSTYYLQKKSHFENLPNHKKETIFIGDSITDGCEWSEMFGNKKIKNRGISGDVTQGVLDRLEEVVESKPKKVFLMIGVNDLARGIATDIIIENISRTVVAINTASPKTKVYVQSILPVNDYYGKFSGHTNKGKEIITINQALQKGVKGDYQYIDLHTSFLDKNQKLDINLSNDGLHLTGNGYQLWTSLIKKYVN
ncbi:MAG: hexosaminidase [Saprospiraceae bacterium]|jgi:hexosaminidase